jgi:hypothetical protein
MNHLSDKEAYAAMFAFLEHRYDMSNSDDLAGLLGSMSTLPDGNPADPAVWEDWLDAIRKAKSGSVRSDLQLK